MCKEMQMTAPCTSNDAELVCVICAILSSVLVIAASRSVFGGHNSSHVFHLQKQGSTTCWLSAKCIGVGGISCRRTMMLFYSLFKISVGLRCAARMVCDPIMMNAIAKTASNPPNNSIMPIGLWKGKLMSTKFSKKR